MLVCVSWLTSPPMRWHRQMDAGEVEIALNDPQQLAGGPARLVPVERKETQV